MHTILERSPSGGFATSPLLFPTFRQLLSVNRRLLQANRQPLSINERLL